MILNTLILLQVLDLLTTWVALRDPRAKEGNALLAKLFSRIGVLPGLMIIKGGFIAWLYWVAPLLPVEVIYLLLALYVWVLWNNLTMLWKLRK